MESVLVFLGGAGLGFLLGSGAGRLSIRKLVFKVASNTVEVGASTIKFLNFQMPISSV